jgi:hypothetical protein
MGYTVNVRSIYRNGYRPVGRTDAFAATHLGSIGTGVALFGPARLHGMGQHRPFPEAGGYTLHGVPRIRSPKRASSGSAAHGTLSGLGALVPDQSILNYVGTWPIPIAFSNPSSQDILNAVVAALENDGLEVRNSSATSGYLASTFTATLQLQVNNGMGFADPNDVISVVRHEVFVATGSFPAADSIPTMQTPGAAGPVATGQPAGPGAAAAIDWSAWLQQNIMLVGAGAAALMVLPMILGRR